MPTIEPADRARRLFRFRLPGLTLIQKIGAGYAAMALFTSIALALSSRNLYAINETARRIAGTDLPAISALIKLRASVLAEEGFAGKYLILRDPAFVGLFRERDRESLACLSLLESLVGHRELAVLRARYDEYRQAAQALFSGEGSDRRRLRATALVLLTSTDNFYVSRQEKLQSVLADAERRRAMAINWSIALSLAGYLLALAVAPFVTYRIFGAIRKLQQATRRIAEGEFDYDLQIPDGDEISELARDFTRMAERLKELEQINIDASPLTRLPGNAAIERVLEQRLQSGTPFAFCYADLDNFKPFSDHYGYAKGSELLRVTGELIYGAVQAHGGADGFVGHIGGDDFVMVVAADRAVPVCDAVISGFDAEASRHYAAADIAAGGIAGCDRYGVERFFPVTTISIAVILCDGLAYASAVEIARAAAVVKDTAKEMPGSSFLISRHGELP